MHNTPLITVLMSVYNGEKYLRDAVESVLEQTFKDFEFLIIDDASTDRTPQILKSYDDSRINVLHNPANLGLAKSLNFGLAKAKGKYIARMDADDISVKSRLAAQYRYLESNSRIALVGSWAEFMDENNASIRIRKTPTDPDIIKFELMFGNCLFHSSIFFRKELVNQIGGYNESYKYAQDYELYSRLVKKYRIANIPEALIRFRLHQDSAVAKPESQEIVRENALHIVFNNISNYITLRESEFDILKNALILKVPRSKEVSFVGLLKAYTLHRHFLDTYFKKENLDNKEIKKILPYYRRRKKLMYKKYLLMKYHKIILLLSKV